MAVLEIAEAVAAMRVKPKRSIIFMWHTGEEAGLLGADYFVKNPTVPRDSIVANINMDMVGRGRAEDLPGGGPGYVSVIGANRLSTDIGSAVERINKSQPRPLKLDYRFDEDVRATLGSSYNNIYGRSDHARYAAVNIPIVFFFTGLHADYHQVTDEPQYIDYPNYTAITRYVNDLLLDIANAAKRPALNVPRT
jgi:Zn-dependent M28 family amino/carboxypeptidase